MNYIYEAIEELEEYNRLRCSLTNLAEEIQDIRSTMPDVKSVIIDDMPHGSAVCSPEDVIVNKLYKIQKKKKEYIHTKRMVERIDRILANISKEKGCEQYGKILRMWYIDRLDKADIATEIMCTERNLYYLKGKALRKFAIELNGIDVMV